MAANPFSSSFLSASYHSTLLLMVVTILGFLAPTSTKFSVSGKPSRGVQLNGDVILGGLFPVHAKSQSQDIPCSKKVYNRGIQRLEAMLYAVDTINNDNSLLK